MRSLKPLGHRSNSDCFENGIVGNNAVRQASAWTDTIEIPQSGKPTEHQADPGAPSASQIVPERHFDACGTVAAVRAASTRALTAKNLRLATGVQDGCPA